VPSSASFSQLLSTIQVSFLTLFSFKFLVLNSKLVSIVSIRLNFCQYLVLLGELLVKVKLGFYPGCNVLVLIRVR